jgi:hypothetical protein
MLLAVLRDRARAFEKLKDAHSDVYALQERRGQFFCYDRAKVVDVSLLLPSPSPLSGLL